MSSVKSYIAILDVGHGNCGVLYEEGKSNIIDCGPGSSVLEFLTEEGISEIDNVFLSHADQDHIEGLVALLATGTFNIKNVFVNPDSTKGSALWDDLIYALSKSSVKGGTELHTSITATNGQFVVDNMVIETVGPTGYLAAKSPGSKDRQDRKITSNSISASFKILWQGTPVVYFAGDIDQIALDDLKDHDITIESPLLVFPHHGGNNSGNVVQFTEELCDLTKPSTVIFSIGRNKHSNPRPEVMNTVRKKIEGVRIACTQLSKHCATTIASVAPVHLNSSFAKGRAKNECCSGTFIIELSDTITYSPDNILHQSYISAVASTPICRT